MDGPLRQEQVALPPELDDLFRIAWICEKKTILSIRPLFKYEKELG